MRKRQLAVAAALTMMGGTGQAAVIYLDFEGIAEYPNESNVFIGGYYSGGMASNGNTGPDLGVEFTAQAKLLCLNTAGTICSNASRGGIGLPGSGLGALVFPAEEEPGEDEVVAAIINVAAGFDTGFAGVFSAPFVVDTTVSIYGGLNGTGPLLASRVLGTTPRAACDPAIAGAAQYCPFVGFSVGFAGTARSVVFGGTVNRQVFDDLTFGSVRAGGVVPEPATWAMMVLGFGAVGAALRRRTGMIVRC